MCAGWKGGGEGCTLPVPQSAESGEAGTFCVRLMRAVDCSELRCWTLQNCKLPSFGSSESPGLVTEWQVILAPHREQDRTKINQIVHLTTSRQVALCSHPLEQDQCVKFLGMEAGERAQWIKLSTDWEFRCPKPKSQVGAAGHL